MTTVSEPRTNPLASGGHLKLESDQVFKSLFRKEKYTCSVVCACVSLSVSVRLRLGFHFIKLL